MVLENTILIAFDNGQEFQAECRMRHFVLIGASHIGGGLCLSDAGWMTKV